MNRNVPVRSVVGKLVATALGIVAAAALGPARPAAAQTAGTPSAPAAAPRTAAEAFKNVQVLKDIPPEQLFPTMQFIAASLGVECEHCHVQRAPEKDDKVAKRTARKMMQMMATINAASFGGEREVTCYSCHRGAITPVAIPAIAESEPAPRPEPAAEGTPAAAPTVPAADQLVARWVQALGGEATLRKVSSRVQKGTMTASGGRTSPIEIYAKAPDKRLSVSHGQRGESITAYDGRTGWMTGREGARPMSAAESEAASLDADLHLALHVKERFPALSVPVLETVAEREAYVVEAAAPGRLPVKLYFDRESGLLVRVVRYADTALGLNPTQVEYGDYRDVGGVKVAFRWAVARPSGRFTIQADTTEHNVAIDDARFVMPAPEPAPPAPK
jgi:photosynthetic reaction center cytochrome c subunit